MRASDLTLGVQLFLSSARLSARLHMKVNTVARVADFLIEETSHRCLSEKKNERDASVPFHRPPSNAGDENRLDARRPLRVHGPPGTAACTAALLCERPANTFCSSHGERSHLQGLKTVVVEEGSGRR